jgi:hypothetical protein
MQWQYSICNTIWSMTHTAVRTCSGSTVYATQLLETVTVEVQEQRLAINLNHTIKQTLKYQHLLLPLHKTLQMTSHLLTLLRGPLIQWSLLIRCKAPNYMAIRKL